VWRTQIKAVDITKALRLSVGTANKIDAATLNLHSPLGLECM
jgi:hypothetical protein